MFPALFTFLFFKVAVRAFRITPVVCVPFLTVLERLRIQVFGKAAQGQQLTRKGAQERGWTKDLCLSTGGLE
jgi:hypothetical protein